MSARVDKESFRVQNPPKHSFYLFLPHLNCSSFRTHSTPLPAYSFLVGNADSISPFHSTLFEGNNKGYGN